MWDIASIIILGITAQWISWRLKLPAILPLILIGMIVGPLSTLITDDGSKWIEPVFQADKGVGLFPGQTLFYFVSLAIGIILFEGGLTLKKQELKGVQNAIARLITIGSAITFIGAGVFCHFVMGLGWQISFLFGALIIVTGPTVIAPILRNLPLNRKVATVLKWEGILIDPIGALVAVLVFEFILSTGDGQHFTMHALSEFGKILLFGGSFGFTFAYALNWFIRSKLIPHYLINVFTLALVMGVFVLSDAMAHESGLLAVVVMGLVLGNMDTPEIKEILDFKESLSILLISILFILLSANIDISHLQLLLDWRCGVLLALIIFVLRPIGVFLSIGADMTTNEKLFVSWIGPRGIVAAGIASLFGLKLTLKGVPDAEYITPLVFMVVLGTVLLVALTSRTIAKSLKVTKEKSDGIMLIGVNMVSRFLAKFLKSKGRHVVLLDNNERNISKAKEEGLDAIVGNIYSDDFNDNIDLLDMGFLLALTGSKEVNKFACEKFSPLFGEEGTYRLVTAEERKGSFEDVPEGGLFSAKDDFINLSEVIRDYPTMHEEEINSEENFFNKMKAINEEVSSIPLFVETNEGVLKILPAKYQSIDGNTVKKLMYVGKAI